jgi:hypothetical protein
MMKTVILLSKTFFRDHPKAGKPTYFNQKVLANQMTIKKPNMNVTLIAPDGSEIKERKIHTCRANYDYWKENIDQLKAANGVLSVREWIEKPYRKPGQNIIIDIPAENVEVQKLSLWINKRTDFYVNVKIAPIYSITEWDARVNGNNIPISVLASNDGLTVEDYMAWFLPVFEKEKADVLDFAIIHFTKFRY